MVDTVTPVRQGRYRAYRSFLLELARGPLGRQGECHSEMVMPVFMTHLDSGVLDTIYVTMMVFGIVGSVTKGMVGPSRNPTGVSADPHLTRIAVVRCPLLGVCDGDVGMMITRIGRESVGSQVDVRSVRPRFGDLRDFPWIGLLVCVVRTGCTHWYPTRGNLVNKLGYGNHSGVSDH